MPKIVDIDDLTLNDEITVDTSTLSITINPGGTNFDSNNDGISLQCIYSFLKKLWKDNASYPMYDFPMVSITNEQFELQNGWDFADQTTKDMVRDGGWALVSGGVSEEEYMCVTTLGSFDDAASDLAYYLQVSAGTPTDVVLTGPVNQAVKIYGDASHGDFDYRTYFQIFLREQGKTYSFGDLIIDQSISSLTYKKYALPISNGLDLKVTESDANIGTQAPYTGMSITWGSVQRDIGGTNRDFGVVIDGNNGTAEQIYEFVQYSLRQTTDIDAGAGNERGDITDELLEFVGDTLKTKQTSLGEGVYIDNFNSADTNRLVFVDDTGTERTFPYVAAGSIAYNDNIQNDADSKFWMFFENSNAADLTSTFTINNTADTITYEGGDSEVDFTGLVAGQLFTLASTSGGTNDGTYEVASTTQTVVTINPAYNDFVGDETSTAGIVFTTTFDYGTDEAVIVDDNSDADIAGLVANDLGTVTNADFEQTPDQIDVTGLGDLTTLLANGDKVHIVGSTNNDGLYTVDTVAAGYFTVAETGSLTSETSATPEILKVRSSISFDFDYDGNVQRGPNSAAEDAPIVLVCIGTSTAQYVKATGTIQRSNANNFSLVAALERNYYDAP